MKKKSNFFRKSGTTLYPLDLFSNAVFGFGLKKLKSTATVACRIRRNSDSAETDIYLYDDPTLSVDMSSSISAGGTLGDWIDTGTGYINKIITLYDQTGNGNDLTGSIVGFILTNSLQLDGGSSGYGSGTNTEFNHSSSEQMTGSAISAFDSGNDFTIINASMMNSAHQGCVFATATSGNRAQVYMDKTATKYGARVIASTSNADANLDAGYDNTGLGPDYRHQISIFKGSSTELDFYRDGNADETGVSWSGTYNNTNIVLGYQPTFNNGATLEILAFSEDKTADVASIWQNFKDRYGDPNY